jgi:DNA-binding NarL/FixJ family response regulator
MEEGCRVFIIGESVFSEALDHLLASYTDMIVVGKASSQATAATAVAQACPHVIIIAGSSEHPPDKFGTILSRFPDLPLISVDPGLDYVQVITSRRVQTHHDDLLAAIRELSAHK